MQTKEKPSSQVSLKTLTRTPAGNVYHHDLKSIYAVLLYCLDLKPKPKRQSTPLLKIGLKRTQSFSFSVDRAIKVMSNLQIDLQYNLTLTKLLYEINSTFAFELLQIFYAAKLLHCPDNRTCKKLTSKKQILQPTPKGVAILHQFCLKRGVPNIKNIVLPAILNSSFNSMQLIEFERHSRTDSIIHSENSDKLLFIQLMGPSMNVWSSKNGPDQIKDLGSFLNTEIEIDNPIYGSCARENGVNPLESEAAFFEYLKQRQEEQTELTKVNLTLEQKVTKTESATSICSPFYHRFFTNPDSDSHIQYYVSNSGLRFFKKKIVTINSNKKIINNCFSGKALIQCILDCTDVMYYKEALKVANEFMKLKLIRCESAEKGSVSSFSSSKDCLYSLTDYGYHLVRWIPSDVTKGTHSPSSSDSGVQSLVLVSSKTLTLDKVLKDPALKYLFKKFMLDNVCVENLLAYDDIVDFQKKIKILSKMIFLKDREKIKFVKELKKVDIFRDADLAHLQANALQHKKLTIYTAINKLSEYCLSKVYTIFAMYISEDGPSELNIDSKLRFAIKRKIQEDGEFGSPCIDITELKSKINSEILQATNDISNAEVGDQAQRIFSDDTSCVKSSSSSSTSEKVDSINPVPNLTLDLKRTNNFEIAPASPTDIFFGPKLQFLEEVASLYEEIRSKVYRMMQTDSLGKFLESDQFKEYYYSL